MRDTHTKLLEGHGTCGIPVQNCRRAVGHAGCPYEIMGGLWDMWDAPIRSWEGFGICGMPVQNYRSGIENMEVPYDCALGWVGCP